jgi:hypothetical protein
MNFQFPTALFIRLGDLDEPKAAMFFHEYVSHLLKYRNFFRGFFFLENKFFSSSREIIFFCWKPHVTYSFRNNPDEGDPEIARLQTDYHQPVVPAREDLPDLTEHPEIAAELIPEYSETALHLVKPERPKMGTFEDWALSLEWGTIWDIVGGNMYFLR